MENKFFDIFVKSIQANIPFIYSKNEFIDVQNQHIFFF